MSNTSLISFVYTHELLLVIYKAFYSLFSQKRFKNNYFGTELLIRGGKEFEITNLLNC